MKKLIFVIITILALTGCSGVKPRAGAGVGMGIGVGFSGKKPVVRPYFNAGIGAGLVKFF